MFLLVDFPRDGSTERSRGLWMVGNAVYSLSLVSCPCMTVDAAIQFMIFAYCYPGDTGLRTIQLPTGIDCIFHFRRITYA